MDDENIENKEVPEETPEETPEPETTEESSPPDTGKPEEPQIPLSRLNKEIDKRRVVEAELQESKKGEVPEEEKKIREIIDKREQEKSVQKIEEDKQLKKELDETHEIYGEFDKDKLLKIVDRYGVHNDNGKIDWDKAMELYQKLDDVPTVPKKKTPSSQRTSDVPRKEPYDVSKKSMWEVLEDAKKEIPE